MGRAPPARAPQRRQHSGRRPLGRAPAKRLASCTGSAAPRRARVRQPTWQRYVPFSSTCRSARPQSAGKMQRCAPICPACQPLRRISAIRRLASQARITKTWVCSFCDLNMTWGVKIATGMRPKRVLHGCSQQPERKLRGIAPGRSRQLRTAPGLGAQRATCLRCSRGRGRARKPRAPRQTAMPAVGLQIKASW